MFKNVCNFLVSVLLQIFFTSWLTTTHHRVPSHSSPILLPTEDGWVWETKTPPPQLIGLSPRTAGAQSTGRSARTSETTSGEGGGPFCGFFVNQAFGSSSFQKRGKPPKNSNRQEVQMAASKKSTPTYW